jgi:hypothetical protein
MVINYDLTIRKNVSNGILRAICERNVDNLSNFFSSRLGSLKNRQTILILYLHMLFPMRARLFEDIKEYFKQFICIYFHEKYLAQDWDFINATIKLCVDHLEHISTQPMSKINEILNVIGLSNLEYDDELDQNLFLLYCLHMRVLFIFFENQDQELQIIRTKNDPELRHIILNALRKILVVKGKAHTYLSVFEQETASY